MIGNPATSPPHRRGHSRSVSHPFPSPFGGITKRRNRSISKKDNLMFDSDDEDDDEVTYLPDPNSSSPRKGAARPTPAEEMTSGKCMVCNSTVRWPRNLKVFRCTECLTVNDLEPFVDSGKAGGNGLSVVMERHPPPRCPEKVWIIPAGSAYGTSSELTVFSYAAFHRANENDFR